MTNAVTIAQQGSNNTTFRNRIINGATVDQTYTLDRWMIRNGSGAGRFSVVQSSTSAANFPTSVLLTVTTTSAPSGTEFYGLAQNVEGYNMADFGWGTANAQSVTASFQVRSSLTGTYCVSLRNSGGTRSYVAEFTISAANTFETKTVSIPGDTSGTWLTTNGIGIIFQVCLGSGTSREGTANSWQGTNIVATSNQVDWINTSGATFYLTGVQLEKGSTASPFEYRSYGTELALCQRYYYSLGGETAYQNINTVIWYSSTECVGQFSYPVTMRAIPTVSKSGNWTTLGSGSAGANLSGDQVTTKNMQLGAYSGSGGTAGYGATLRANNDTSLRVTFSAEL
jgi:hypothetical protein